MVSEEYKKFKAAITKTAKDNYNDAVRMACQWVLNRPRALRIRSLSVMVAVLCDVTKKDAVTVEHDIVYTFVTVPFSARTFREDPDLLQRENPELASWLGMRDYSLDMVGVTF